MQHPKTITFNRWIHKNARLNLAVLFTRQYTIAISHALISFVFLILLFAPPIKATEIPNIAAAASTKFALQEIVDSFYQDTGNRVRVSYGSSGILTRQIQQGAPFELFLSANAAYVKQLHQQQKTLDQGVIYALGRLVLLANKTSSLSFDEQLTGVKKMLQTGRLQRFAIANPAHAPYGIAAQEVLKKLTLWRSIKPHLVFGENVAQAAQFAHSGVAQMGLISYSLALAPALQHNSQLLLPATLHQPIQQSMVLLINAGKTSKLFFDYLQQDKARAILSRYGYSIP